MKNIDKPYEFRIKDIAAATTLKPRTVERAIRRGELWPHNLADVARYISMWRMKLRLQN